MYGKVPTKVKLPVKEHIQDDVRLLYGGVDETNLTVHIKLGMHDLLNRDT